MWVLGSVLWTLGVIRGRIYEVWEQYRNPRGSYGVVYLSFGKCMGTLSLRALCCALLVWPKLVTKSNKKKLIPMDNNMTSSICYAPLVCPKLVTYSNKKKVDTYVRMLLDMTTEEIAPLGLKLRHNFYILSKIAIFYLEKLVFKVMLRV